MSEFFLSLTNFITKRGRCIGTARREMDKWSLWCVQPSARNHKSSSLPAASRCAAAPTARGATIPCTMLTAKRPRMPPSSGTSIPCVTAATTTTAKRAFTTSRAGTTTLPTAGSLTPTPSLPPTPTASSAPICSRIVRITRLCLLTKMAGFQL